SSIALIFCPYFLAFARLGYNNIQSLFITTLALYWLYLGTQRSSVFYLYLAGCAAGFGFYTYFAARMALVIATLFIFLLWIGRKLKFRHAALALALLAVGVLLVVGPYLVYGTQYDAQGMSFKMFESVFFNTFNGLQFYSQEELTAVTPIFELGGNELFYNPEIYLVLLARGLARTLLIFQKPWLISEHFIASPLAGTIGVVFYLIGLGALFKRIREPRGLLLAVWFLVTIFALSVLNTVPPRHTHMVSLLPALALMTGAGIHILASAVSAVHANLTKLKTTFIGILTAIVALGGIYDYFILMPSRYHPYADQIISWASVYAQDEAFVFVYSEPHEVDIVRPYLITEFYPNVSYTTVSFEDFRREPETYITEEKTLVFYMPGLAEEIEPLLTAQWPQEIVLRDFYNPDGIPVLSAGMNTPFVFERDRSFLEVIRESYGRLPLLVFLAILFIIFGLIAFIPTSWTLRLPRRIRSVAGWFNAPVRQVEEAEEPIEPEDRPEVPIPHEAPPAEPPAWVDEVFELPRREKAGKVKVEARSVPAEQGRDVYLRLHLPTLRLPWKHLPEGMRLSLPALQIPQPVLLSGVVGLAIAAQIYIHFQNFLVGAILYLLGIAGLVYWARKNPKWLNALTNQARIPPRAELVIGLLLLVVVIFTRFYDLGYRVYGLEADETKWTVQSWLSTILRVDQGEFAGMHYRFLPVDFWARSIFLRVFGLNFMSARLESAIFSVIAVVFLYLLIRRLTASPPTALLGAAVYAFSFIELNGSHQALHNTTLEPWMMAGLYYLVAGLQDHKWWQFQVAGIVLALGMLTYETFFPTVGAALVFVLGLAIAQIFRRQANARQWLQRLLLLGWPILLVYLTFTRRYLEARHGYHFGWLENFSEGGTDLSGAVSFVLQNISDLLKTTFSSVVYQDSLLRWNGAFLNQLILPFVVIGLAYNLCRLRRPYFLFIPLWYLFNIVAAPLLLGSVWPRVLYTGLAPLAIWAAMGLWVFLAALRPWMDFLKVKVAVPTFILLLLVIFANDYRIFTTGISDPVDRVKRRELADLTAASAADTDLLLYPYFPAQNDAVELETHVLLFSVAGARHLGLEAGENFLQIPYDQLLPFLWENRDRNSLDVFYDKTALSMQEERTDALALLLDCYPGASLRASGEYFDVYHLDAATLSQPECYQSAPPILVAPPEGAEISSGASLIFAWDTGSTATTSFLVSVEQHVPEVYWIEAEDAFQTNGWYLSSEFVAGFSGNGFLLDNWQSGEAQTFLRLDEEGEYRVWVRAYKRRYNDQQNFITVNGQTFYFSGNDVPLDTWYWESVGTFDLPAGDVTLSLGRLYGQDEMFSVFIDSLLVTSDIDKTPEETAVWQTVYTSEERFGSQTQFTLDLPLPPGEYRWSVRVFDGDRLVDSAGERGIAMPYAEFTLIP
ncbi:MAG: glycosyltransferase family 39 protein, partial [Chloroflexota bacterium]